jgi:hypothetical protein
LEVEGGLIESLERFDCTGSVVKVVKLDAKLMDGSLRAKTADSWLGFGVSSSAYEYRGMLLSAPVSLSSDDFSPRQLEISSLVETSGSCITAVVRAALAFAA